MKVARHLLSLILPQRRRAERNAAKLRHDIPEITAADEQLIISIRPYTMTGAVRRHALLRAVRYANQKKLPGSFVECGVWRGGNVFLAKIIQDREFPEITRDFYLFDTFEGMTEPGAYDLSPTGESALTEYSQREASGEGWCVASRADVEAGAMKVLGSLDRLHFVEGKVETTLKDASNLPKQIAILRLDTDWYESTKAELEILYPLLVSRGVLIIDDYGAWQGAKRAVDEYFAGQPVFMHRVDHTCRIIIKD